MSESRDPQGPNLEVLLTDALRPIEPPERLSERLESTLSKVSEVAANELSVWAEELTESELQSLRDPRNWIRPVAAATASGIAGAGLILFEVRRRRRQGGLRGVAGDLWQRLP
jgi:hypothetical protein